MKRQVLIILRGSMKKALVRNNIDCELLEEIISANPDGMFAVDCDYRILYWSKTMEQLFGMNRNYVLQKNIFEIVPLFKNTEEENCYIQAFSGQTIISSNKLSISLKADNKFYFKNYYSPLQAKDGKVIGGIVLVRDLSKKLEAEKRIQESEDRFRVMSDCAPVAIWMSRKDGLCDYFNQGWLEFSGRTLEEEFGLGWADRIHDEDYKKVMDTYFNAFNSRNSFIMKYRLQRHDGQFRWLLDQGKLRFTQDGEFLGYIGSCIDITDQIVALNELDDTVKKLEAALKARDDFISIASHELKTPLTPLKTYLYIIKTQIVGLSHSSSETLFNIIERMDSQINHILKIIDNLLDFSHISNQLLELTIEKVDLVHVVCEVVKRYKILNPYLSFKLFFSNKESEGQWDKMRIEQIIDNIVNNAIKYGEGNPIEIHLLEEKTQVKLIIRDKGIGIPKNVQTPIFDKFERAVSSENFPGLGLGLYIVKKNLSLHGGTITVDSGTAKGSTFTVVLPKDINCSPHCTIFES